MGREKKTRFGRLAEMSSHVSGRLLEMRQVESRRATDVVELEAMRTHQVQLTPSPTQSRPIAPVCGESPDGEPMENLQPCRLS